MVHRTLVAASLLCEALGHNDATNLMETKGSSSQSSDYQHYIPQDYQQYMKTYAGGKQGGSQGGASSQYMAKYAGQYEKYADYQKYMKERRHMHHSVQHARDAQNVSQLDAWRDNRNKAAELYVPAQYANLAKKHTAAEYKKRLNELQHKSQNSGLGADTEVPAILDLAAKANPKAAKADTKAAKADTEETEETDTQQLYNASEAVVTKAENLGQSMKSAAGDKQAIEELASKPAQKVTSSFTKRSSAVDNNIDELKKQDLQSVAQSKQSSEDFQKNLRQTKGEVSSLKSDELNALEEQHRQASEVTRSAARGAQKDVRQDARKVERMSNKLARKDRSYQEQVDKLQQRAEAAADVTEQYSEELARNTEERLQDHLSTVSDEVQKTADRRMETLHGMEEQLQEVQAQSATETEKSNSTGSTSFLAQFDYYDAFLASSSQIAILVSAAVAFAALMFFAKRSSRAVKSPEIMLG